MALITYSYLVFFLFLTVAGAVRTKVHSFIGPDRLPSPSSPDANDGLCKSLIGPQGYACLDYKVTTQDGYILSLQRIPTSRSGMKPNKPPVLLQHGLFLDGTTWLINSPDESLAFILADNGYDVWISNTRGTKWSQGHTKLSSTDPAFWDWSWDELAAFDLPAVVGYVNNQTGQNLHYVGHSLGTLMALASFSQGKVMNMLRSAALLSPIAHLNHITSLLVRGAADLFLAETIHWLGIHEFIPRGSEAAQLVKNVCDNLHLDCQYLLTPVTGPNCCLNSTRRDVFLDHEPQSTATKNLIHLAQMVRRGSITMYDYGNPIVNMEHYNQSTPPVYDMTSIPKDFPLFLGYGGLDALSDVRDVQLLLDSLKNHDGDKLVIQYTEEYAHADFVFGVNANRIVYDPMMAFFGRN